MLTEKGEKNTTFHELKTIAARVRAEGEIIDVASGQMAKLGQKLSAFLKGHSLLIIICLFSLILRVLWIKIPVHGDEGEAGYDAMLWLRGNLPYAFHDMDKPPLIPIVPNIDQFVREQYYPCQDVK
jgi:hypothetical protein